MPRGEFLPQFTPPEASPKRKRFLTMEERTSGLKDEEEKQAAADAVIAPLENVGPQLNRKAKREKIVRIESQDPEPIDPTEDLFEEHEEAIPQEKIGRAARPVRIKGEKVLGANLLQNWKEEGAQHLKEINEEKIQEGNGSTKAKKVKQEAEDLAAVREMLKMAKEPAEKYDAQKREERAAWVMEQKQAQENRKMRQRKPGYDDVQTLDFSRLPDNKVKWQPREGFVRPELPPEELKVPKKAKPEKFDIPFPLEPQAGIRMKKPKGFEERTIPTEIVKTVTPPKAEKKGFLSSLADSKLGKWAKRTALALGIMAASPASNRGPEQTQTRAAAASVKEVPPELQKLGADVDFDFSEPEIVKARTPSVAKRVPSMETPKGYIRVQESDLQPEDYVIKGKVSTGSRGEKAPRGSNASKSESPLRTPYEDEGPKLEKKEKTIFPDPYEDETTENESETIPEISTSRKIAEPSYERETRAPKEVKAEIKSPRLQSERMNPFNPRGPEVKKVSRNAYYDGASGSLFKIQGDKLTEIRFDWRGMPRKILIGQQGENGKYTPTDVIPVFEGKAMINGKPAAESIQDWVQEATELRNKSM